MEEAGKGGLTVSISKTKGMAVGEGLADEDVAPLLVEGGEIEDLRRDLVSRDLQAIGMERRWYQWCQDRHQWRRHQWHRQQHAGKELKL